jgi:hypothetical protein
MSNLDPLPWFHACWDDGTCPDYGSRQETETSINDEFRPREGYEQDRSKYE